MVAAFRALADDGVAIVPWFDPVAAAAAAGAPGTAMPGTIADGRLWHAWGASEVQELAIAVATLVALLRSAERAGTRAADRLPTLAIALAADSDQFLTVAKFRAMRLLAMRLAGAIGSDARVPIHAETAWRMMSRREPRMNTLRTTGAAFAAAVGGADSITVLAHDVLDGDTAGSRRLARNTQLILAEEAQVFRTADPGAGSGAVEALTDALAEHAWAHFQRIEAEGGVFAGIEEGWLPAEVGTMRARRLDAVGDGAVDMVGVNVFAEETARRSDVRDAHDRLAFRRIAEAVEGG
jgi:methylmalonyl-CoA mutase